MARSQGHFPESLAQRLLRNTSVNRPFEEIFTVPFPVKSAVALVKINADKRIEPASSNRINPLGAVG
jgi:hypothetical protein